MYNRNPFYFIRGVSTNGGMVCKIIDHTIQFIKHPLLRCIQNEYSQTYHPITYLWWFTSKSSFKILFKKYDGLGVILILWIDISLSTYNRNWYNFTFRCFVCGLNLWFFNHDCTRVVLKDVPVLFGSWCINW